MDVDLECRRQPAGHSQTLQQGGDQDAETSDCDQLLCQDMSAQLSKLVGRKCGFIFLDFVSASHAGQHRHKACVRLSAYCACNHGFATEFPFYSHHAFRFFRRTCTHAHKLSHKRLHTFIRTLAYSCQLSLTHIHGTYLYKKAGFLLVSSS